MTEASNPIARLIDTIKEANRWSDPMIVARAESAGHQRSKSWISNIRNAGMPTMSADTIHALSDGLGVPVSRVLRAVLETMGLPYGDESISPEAAIKADPMLRDDTKAALLAIISEARQRRRPSKQDVIDGINNTLGVDTVTEDDNDDPMSESDDKTDPGRK